MVCLFLYILWQYRGNNSHRETNLLLTFTVLTLCELPVTTDSKEEKSQAAAYLVSLQCGLTRQHSLGFS